MIDKLLKTRDKIEIESLSLKDLALFFERYDGYMYKIETENQILKIRIEKNSLPHLIGMQHAYSKIKNKLEYSGAKGFNKLKNGDVTVAELKRMINANTASGIAWKNIRERIEHLPMFLNTLSDMKNGTPLIRLKNFDKSSSARNTKMKCDYLLFREVRSSKPKYLVLSIKKISLERLIIETFIVEDDIKLLGAQLEDKILSVEKIEPLDITSPSIFKKN